MHFLRMCARSVILINQAAFYLTGLVSVIVPSSVTFIGSVEHNIIFNSYFFVKLIDSLCVSDL
jgi:hypothetical protein